MTDQKPDEAPALDDLEENPDEFVGEEVEPEHTLDLDAFTELDDE